MVPGRPGKEQTAPKRETFCMPKAEQIENAKGRLRITSQNDLLSFTLYYPKTRSYKTDRFQSEIRIENN
jgi:hypothetical protein